MGKFIFIIGGARSGKSHYATCLAKNAGKKVTFIATCIPKDAEMKNRVALHKKERPRFWKTIEEPKNIKSVLTNLKNRPNAVIVDCIGLVVSNFLSDALKKNQIENKITSIACALSKANFTAIVVSNDVGSGIVPASPLARKFRDMLGLANQIMAKKANEVIFMQAGIPMVIKSNIKDQRSKI